MPNIKSAKKKMKQDASRTARNKQHSAAIDNVLKTVTKATKAKKDDVLKKAYSIIDKAAKKKVIHGNRAGRLKARVSRLVRAK